MSTKEQRKKIGCLRKLLGLKDDLYREMLFERFNAVSSTKLTISQANEFYKELKKKAIEEGLIKPRSINAFQKYNYNNLNNRDSDMATPKQLRMIEAMWSEVSRIQNTKDRKTALNTFINRICGVENIRFLKKSAVAKIIKAIKSMKKE